MSSVCAFSASHKCCKFIEFYYASAFTGDKWNNQGSQAVWVNFYIINPLMPNDL
jgi:hypothetical protein